MKFKTGWHAKERAILLCTMQATHRCNFNNTGRTSPFREALCIHEPIPIQCSNINSLIVESEWENTKQALENCIQIYVFFNRKNSITPEKLQRSMQNHSVYAFNFLSICCAIEKNKYEIENSAVIFFNANE